MVHAIAVKYNYLLKFLVEKNKVKTKRRRRLGAFRSFQEFSGVLTLSPYLWWII
jgi:hypothetical protein